MAKYVKITKKQMDAFMDGNGFLCSNPNATTAEYVYTLSWHGGKYKLKVYSSITKKDTARAAGNDAIRVALLVRVNNKYVGAWKGARVHRVAGWRKNLQARIDLGLATGCEGEDWQCKKCGGYMLLREGKSGYFYGCNNYFSTGCSFTMNYEPSNG